SRRAARDLHRSTTRRGGAHASARPGQRNQRTRLRRRDLRHAGRELSRAQYTRHLAPGGRRGSLRDRRRHVYRHGGRGLAASRDDRPRRRDPAGAAAGGRPGLPHAQRSLAAPARALERPGAKRVTAPATSTSKPTGLPWPSHAPVMVDNGEVGTADVHEEEIESRFEATFGVALVMALQVTLALVSLEGGWKLIGLPGWVWLIPTVPEAALLLPLAWSAPRHRLEQMGRRRMVALALVGVITAANVLALA